MFISKKYVDTRIRSLIAKFSNFMNRVIKLEAIKSNKDHEHTDLITSINNINTLLTANDTTLDELQEVINFIKQNKSDLDNLSVSNIAGLQLSLNDKSDTSHTHAITKSQIGLGNVNNTSDANKPISNTTQTALNGKENTITKGSAFNKNFGTGSNNAARGNHSHSAPSSPLTGISTSNGSSNNIFGLKQSYPGGDVPDGWEFPIAIKTNLTHPITNKPIYLTGHCWSGFMGIPPE